MRGIPDDLNAFKGDFKHFYWAAQAMANGQNIYDSGTHGYIYPPLLAAALSWMALLPLRAAQLLWIPINLGITISCLAMASRAARNRLRLPQDELTTAVLWVSAVALTFDPIRFEFQEGQTDTIVLWGLLSCLSNLDKRPWRAGAAIGLAANIKYQALVALPYLLIRRRFKAAGATVVSAVAWALVPAVVCGWDRNLSYLATAFRGVARLFGGSAEGPSVQTHDIRWLMSVSIPSAVARFYGEGASGAVIGGTCLVIGLAFAGVIWWIYRRHGVELWNRPVSASTDEGATLLEWCGLIVLVLAFSPQSMVRHGFLLIPVHMVAGALLLAGRHGVKPWALLTGVLIMQVGSRLPPGDWEATRGTLDWWRSIGGTSWCMLLMYATLVWCGLAELRAMLAGRAFRDLAGGGSSVGVGAAGPT